MLSTGTTRPTAGPQEPPFMGDDQLKSLPLQISNKRQRDILLHTYVACAAYIGSWNSAGLFMNVDE